MSLQRIHKYIGSYATRMHGVDVIVFTAGVGENSDVVRAKVLEGLEFMGVYWDPKKNEGLRGKSLYQLPTFTSKSLSYSNK